MLNIIKRMHVSLMLIKDEFNFEKVVSIAFKHCPKEFTKQQILELATNVLDDELNEGTIKLLKDGTYMTMFAYGNYVSSSQEK